jgi:Type II intron maturase
MVFDRPMKSRPSFFCVRPTLPIWRAATYYSLCRPPDSHSESQPSCACFSKVSYRKGADLVRARKHFTQKPPATVAGLLACLRAMATAFKAASLEGCCKGLRDARRCCPYYDGKRGLKLRAHQKGGPPLMFKAIASHVALRFAHHKVLLVHNHFGFVHKRAQRSSQGQVVQTTRHPFLPKPQSQVVFSLILERRPGQQPSPIIRGGVANTPFFSPFAARDHIIHSAIALALEQLMKGSPPPSLSFKAVNSTVVVKRPRALKGVHSALAHIKHHWRGVSWFLAFEIKSYDTIDRPRPKAFLQERIDDPTFFVLMHQLSDAGACAHHLRRAVRRRPVIAPPIAADVTPPNPPKQPRRCTSPINNGAKKHFGPPNVVDTGACPLLRTAVVCKVKKEPPWVCDKPACFGPLQPNVLPPIIVFGLRRRHQSSGWCPLTVLRTVLLNTDLPLSYVSCGPRRSLLFLTPYALSQTWGVVKQLFKHQRCSSSVPSDTGGWKPGVLWRLVVWAGLRNEETQRLRITPIIIRAKRGRNDCVLVKHRWRAAASRQAVASKHRRGDSDPKWTSVQAAPIMVSTGCTRHPSLCGEAKNKAAGFVAQRLAVYSRCDERRPKLGHQKHPRLALTIIGAAGFPKGFLYPQLTTSTFLLGCLLMKGRPRLLLSAAEAWKGCLRVQVLCRPIGSGFGPVPRRCLLVRAWFRHAQRLCFSKQKKTVLQLVLAWRYNRGPPKALFKNPTVTLPNITQRVGGHQTTWLLNQDKGTLNKAFFDFGANSRLSEPLSSFPRAKVAQTALRLADSVFDLSVQVKQKQAPYDSVKHKQFKQALPFVHRTQKAVTAACLQTRIGASEPNHPTTVRPYVRLKYTLGHIGLQQLDLEIDRLRTTFETKHPSEGAETKTDNPIIGGVQRAAFTLSDPFQVVFKFCQGAAGLSERLFRIGGSQATGTAQYLRLGTSHFAHSAAAEASKCDLESAPSAAEEASCFVPSERPVRVRYVRYANLLLLGIAGTASIVKNLRNRIIHCVQSDLKLPLGLAHCTHLKARQAALFLGFRLVAGTQPSHHETNRVLYPEREKRRRRRLRHLARLYKRAGYVAAKGGRLRRTVPLIRPAAALASLGAFAVPSTGQAKASLSFKSSAKRPCGRIRTRSYKCVPTTKEVTGLVSTSLCSFVATSPLSAVRLAAAAAASVRGSCTTGSGLDLPSRPTCSKLRWWSQTGSVFKPATCLPLTKGQHTWTPQPGLTWRRCLRYKQSTGRRPRRRRTKRLLYSLGVLKAPEVLRTKKSALLREAAQPLYRTRRRCSFEDCLVSPSFALQTGCLSKTQQGACEMDQSVHHQFLNRRRFLLSADDPAYSVLKHTVLSLTVLWCGVNHLALRQPCLQCPAARWFGPPLYFCLSTQQTGSEAAASCRANSVTKSPEVPAATRGFQKTAAYGRQTTDDTAYSGRQVVKRLVFGESVLLTSPEETSVPAHVPSSFNEARCAAKSIPYLPLDLRTSLNKHLWPKRWLFHLDKPPYYSLGQGGLRQVKTGRRPPVLCTQAETIRSFGRSVVDQKSLRLTAPLDIILKLLRERGFITAKRARPSHVARLSNLPDQHIVQYYKGVALGLLNYYRGCDNLDKVKSIVDYQIYWSALFTLANKHKTSARQIRRTFPPA